MTNLYPAPACCAAPGGPQGKALPPSKGADTAVRGQRRCVWVRAPGSLWISSPSGVAWSLLLCVCLSLLPVCLPWFLCLSDGILLLLRS